MADVLFEFGGGASELLKNLKEVREEFTKTRDETLAAKKEMQETFQDAAKSADTFKTEYEKLLKAHTEQSRLLEMITKKYGELSNAQKSFANTGGTDKQKQRIKELTDEVSRLKKQYENIDVSKAIAKIAEFNAQLAKVKENTKLGLKIEDTDVTKLAESAQYIRENYEQIQNDLSGSAATLKNRVAEYTDTIKFMEVEIKRLHDAFDNLAPGKQKAGLQSELEGMKTMLEKDINTLQDFKEQLASVEGANKNLATSVQQSSKIMETLAKANKSAVATIAVDLVSSLDLAKQKLSTLTEGTSAYDQLAAEIAAAEMAITRMTVKVDENGNATGGARAELQAYKKALEDLRSAGLDTTEVYSGLQKDAAGLSSSIQDVNKELKNTSGIDRMVRGVTLATNTFGLLQGVMALTGEENKDLQETLVRLNALMLITNSLQQVSEELKRKDTIVTSAQIALQKTYTIVVGETTGALKAFRIALAATVIGAVVIGIAALIAKLKEVNVELSETEKRQKLLNEVSTEAADGYMKQELQLKVLNDRVAKSGKSFAEKQTIVQDYNREFGDTIGSVQTYSQLEDKLTKDGPKFIAGLKARANMLAAFGLAVEAGKKSLELANKAPEEFLTGSQKTWQSLEKFAAGIPILGSTLFKDSQKEVEKYDQLAVIAQHKAVTAEDNKKRAMLKVTEEYSEEFQRITSGTSYNYEGGQKKTNKNVVNDAKKTADQLIKIQRELATARIESMTDGLDKERAKLSNEYNSRVEDLLAQKQGASLEEIKSINKLIDAETENHLTEDLALQTVYFDQVRELYEKTGDDINSVLKSDQDKEKESVTKHYDALFKAIAESRKKAEEYNNNTSTGKFDLTEFDEQEKQLREKQGKELLEIDSKYALKKLEQQEQLALSANNILKIQGMSEEALEQLKEQNKLDILIDFAKKRIAILEKMGTDEATIQANQLKKVVADSEKQKKEIEKKSKSKTLFQMWGVDEEETKEFIDTTEKVGKSARYISRALGSIADMYDANIKRREDNIRSIESEIDEQEDKVDKEKDLMDKGYANNLEVEQKKLDDLKARKAEEQRLLEEEQRKKAAIQKAQLIADTIAQTSNLITAASEIFAANSGVPFVGVAIALAAVAAMIGGFLALKSTARSATQTAETGRRVAKGKRHSGGGNKYVSMDGNDQDILEIEEGEWVVNRKASDKYDPLLEAINNGNKVNIPRVQLRRLLEPMGIRLADDLPRQIVANVNASKDTSTIVVVHDDSKKWDEQNQILKKIADKGSSVEYTGDYKIIRKGNLIRKIKIKK